MNNKSIEISNLSTKKIPILSDEEAGEKYNRWSFLNIYSLTALRDIYIITKDVNPKSKAAITEKANKFLEPKQNWEERKVLEYLNALVKLGFLNSNYEINLYTFEESALNSELSNNDLQILKHVFFNYFRFKEISSWFISPEKDFHRKFESLNDSNFINDSFPIYYYSNTHRFTDTFLLDLHRSKCKYEIENSMSHLMRFWDVYLKWGTTLNVLDKFNLSGLGLKAEGQKDLSIVYFIKPFKEFDIIEFMKVKFNSRYIFIPELIFEIVKEYRYSVPDIKNFIIKEINISDKLTFERTSQIFIIKGRQSQKKIEEAAYLYPKIKDTYISNIILRK